MLREDLKKARTTWIEDAGGNERDRRERGSFLVHRDEAGRVLDFHAFRRTFASYLAAGSVNVRDLQTLTRHITAELALGVYAHTLHGNQRAALNALPDLGRPAPLRQRATGADDLSWRNAWHEIAPQRAFRRRNVQ